MSGNQRRVLIVDEDRVRAGLVAVQLRRADFAAVTAESSAAARDAMAWGAPDVILVTLGGKAVDGLALLADLDGVDTAAFVVGARTVEAAEELEAYALGAQGVFVHPLDAASLTARLGSAAARRLGRPAGGGELVADVADGGLERVWDLCARHGLDARVELRSIIGNGAAILRGGAPVDAWLGAASGRDAFLEIARASEGEVRLSRMAAGDPDLARQDVIGLDLATAIGMAFAEDPPTRQQAMRLLEDAPDTRVAPPPSMAPPRAPEREPEPVVEAALQPEGLLEAPPSVDLSRLDDVLASDGIAEMLLDDSPPGSSAAPAEELLDDDLGGELLDDADPGEELLDDTPTDEDWQKPREGKRLLWDSDAMLAAAGIDVAVPDMGLAADDSDTDHGSEDAGTEWPADDAWAAALQVPEVERAGQLEVDAVAELEAPELTGPGEHAAGAAEAAWSAADDIDIDHVEAPPAPEGDDPPEAEAVAVGDEGGEDADSPSTRDMIAATLPGFGRRKWVVRGAIAALAAAFIGLAGFTAWRLMATPEASAPADALVSSEESEAPEAESEQAKPEAEAEAPAEEPWKKPVPTLEEEVRDAYGKGVLAHREGKLDEAARHFRHVLRRMGDHEGAMAGLSATLIEGKSFDEARVMLEVLAKTRPDDPMVQLQLAMVAHEQNDLDIARAALDRFLELAPSGEQARDAQRLLAALTSGGEGGAP